MQKCNNKSIIICADLNLRATIASIRALRYEDVDLIIGTAGYISGFLSIPGLLGNFKKIKHFWFYKAKTEDEFIASLVVLGAKLKAPTIFFPMGEKVLRWAVKNKDILKSSNILVPSHDFKLYEKISNKYSFIKICEKFKLNVPEELPQLPKEYLFPYVVKARKMVWGDDQVLEAPVLVKSLKTHQEILKRKLNSIEHIAQPYIDGPSFYYCALYSNGSIILRFVQQTLIQQPGGKSVICAIPSKIPIKVYTKIDKLFESIQWSGALMVELKLYKGIYYIIECNPRLWGPLQCAIDNGINFPLSLYKMMCSERVNYHHTLNNKKNAYLWLWGFLDGLYHLVISRTTFQIYSAKTDGVKYKDIWLRKDSLLFFFIEPINLFLQWSISLLKMFNWIAIKKFL